MKPKNLEQFCQVPKALTISRPHSASSNKNMVSVVMSACIVSGQKELP